MRTLIVLLFFSSGILAQDASTLFKQASVSYEQKEYEQALIDYKEIQDLGLYSSDLYYNMANCYYNILSLCCQATLSAEIHGVRKALWVR